jgi:prolipoprotein diacylglyceryl transferase
MARVLGVVPGRPMWIASIPSPSSNALRFGPVRFNAYGVCIAVGVVAGVWIAGRRWKARGGHPDDMGRLAVWAVPAGIVGARLYHVATDWQRFEDDPSKIIEIWNGGLGIWGGVALGAIVGLVIGRRLGFGSGGRLLDTAAPAIPIAQAIGRWGNWFNQELFGRPTTQPWGLRIDAAHRPRGYDEFSTFHPTFLSESVWNLAVAGIVVLVGHRFGDRLRPGRLFALYVALYTFGRFFIEQLRIDSATRVGGTRINVWVSVVVFVGALAFLLTGLRRRDPGSDTFPGAAEPAA